MQPPTRFLTIIATALFLAVLCGCTRSDDQTSNNPTDGTNKPAVNAAFETRVKARKPGTLVGPNGAFYEGEIGPGGLADGQGRLAGPNGTDQHGEWQAGKAYRLTGTWVAPDGTKEVGTWNMDGTKSGGTIYWTNGRKYEGDWQITDGRAEIPHGTGVMTWPDGRVYTGQFRDGEMDGRGKMTFPDGKVQAGSWHHGQFVSP